MKIEIFYCSEWNYLTQASRLEDELKGKFVDIEVKLIAGKGGIFKVLLNGKMIFNKEDTLRFPNKNEICRLIKDWHE